jgi:hypothetical protein
MNLTQQQKRVIKDAAMGTPPHIFETGKYKLHPNVIISLEKKELVAVTRLKGGLRQVELTDKARQLITVIVKPPWVKVTFNE